MQFSLISRTKFSGNCKENEGCRSDEIKKSEKNNYYLLQVISLQIENYQVCKTINLNPNNKQVRIF